MKIFVTVKQVPDTSGVVAVNPDGTLDRTSMKTITNPDDMNAVEQALKLKTQYNCKVVALTMGPGQAENMISKISFLDTVKPNSFIVSSDISMIRSPSFCSTLTIRPP